MFASFNLFGQVKDYEVKLRDKKGNPSLIDFKETKVANQAQIVHVFLKQQFKSDDKTEFRPSKSSYQIKRTLSESQNYHQYYNGIKVEYGRLNVLSKNGNLTKVVGRYVDVKNYTTKSNTLDVEVSSLTNGIYLLEINQAGEKITEKIIVQH